MARFQERPQQLRAQLDTGGADVARNLAAKLADFSQRSGQKRSAIVQEQAFKEGQKAEAPKKGDFTEAQRAFNKGFAQSYLAGLDNDNREEISRIMAENPDDIIKFNNAVESYRKGILEQVPEAFSEEASQSLDNQITNARVSVQANTIERTHKEAQKELELHVKNAGDESARLAFEGNALGAAEELIKAQNSIMELDISDAEKDIKFTDLEIESTEQNFKGEMLRIYDSKGYEAAEKYISDIERKTLKKVDQDTKDRITGEMRTNLTRQEARKQAAGRLSLKEAKESLKNYETAKSMGFEVSVKEENNLNRLIAGTDLVPKKKLIDQTAEFSVMSKEDQDLALSEIQTGKLKDVPFFASATKAQFEIQKAARHDGYTLGVKQGIIDFKPLELGNPESVEERTFQAEVLAEHYGVDISILSDNEASGIAEGLPSMTVPEKLQLISTFQNTPAVWEQLDQKGAGVFAMSGAIGDLNVTTPILKGQELLDQKVVKQPTPIEYLADFNDFTEGVYGPRDQRAILDSVIAHYAATSSGATEGIYNSKDFKASMEAVTGGIGEVNGFKLELPRGVSESDFEDFIDNMQPESINDLGGVVGFTDEQAIDAIQEGRIRSIGANKYIVETNGGTLFNPDGEPFIIEYSLEMDAANTALANVKARERRAAVNHLLLNAL